MPASSGPYQSRIFNFVHQQSRKVSEQLGSTIRHLQVAATWGVQVMLYPIYLLFQSTESAEKRFYSSQQNWRQLPEDELDAQPQTPPATDQAIQRVLHLVKVLPSEAVAANPPLPIQGVATQLSTHTLVLVTVENEILDILTPQQQQKLQQRIIEEVANYWCRWMSWVQQDELTHSPSVHLAPVKALAFLDQTLAGLESHHVAPLSEFVIAQARRSWQPVLAVATRLTESLSSNTIVNDTQLTAVAHRTNRQFRIQSLIWAAINYFFGDRRQSLLGQSVPTLTENDLSQKLVGISDGPSNSFPQLHSWQPKGQSLHDSSREVNNDTDSWLTLSDLFEQDAQINPAPDWIETYATAMGYVKHPLEHLLQWLDRAMLWLEELLMRVMQWVQQKIAKKAV